MDAYPIDLGEVVSLLRRKEVRRPIAPAEIQANWQIARLEREDDMRSIYCAREVDNAAIAAVLAAFSFDPVLPA